ncbi:hypothetical protein ACMFFK_09560 [Serratia marcescens]|uniref:hypothetical protein n=1 Tax=Serratia marcescens TaxID=615 RepID=UPI00197E990E|nr:hypothetical protein [Serratia marcescens]MBN3988712.1 hypothetical protein [Serratia marcescens]MCX2170680.1 hypothetical protein [Serratia marcescens]MCX2175284.1 hypothetical protein [Serratia marcescens]
MADFMESINDGLNAAKKADENKNEINSVFDELNFQLGKATNGAAKVIRRAFYKEINTTTYANIAAKMIGESLLNQQRETYLALAISHVNKEYNFNDVEIAKWNIDKNGYPCVITLRSVELYCEDKEALEKALSELMRDPDVGTAVFNCMNFKPRAK